MADLAALVASPWWRWMPGMRGSDDAGRAFRVRTAPTSKHDGIVDYEPCPYTFGGMTRQSLRPVASRPDLTDPATLGCLLALAREAWGDPELFVRREIGGPNWVTIRPGHAQPFRCDTEAAALIAAILAAPPPGVDRG